MTIYSLRAIKPHSPEWGATLHHRCLVNAANEQAARQAAARTLGEVDSSASPWMNPNMVECREIGRMTDPESREEIVFAPLNAPGTGRGFVATP